MSLRRACAAVLATAVVAPGLMATTGTAAAAGSPGGEVHCDYWSVEWGGGLMAEVTVVNDGPQIDGWTVDLDFDDPATLVGDAWNADMAQPSPTSMTAENRPWNPVIPSDGAVAFGWVALASAHDPPVLNLNGVPC